MLDLKSEQKVEYLKRVTGMAIAAGCKVYFSWALKLGLKRVLERMGPSKNRASKKDPRKIGRPQKSVCIGQLTAGCKVYFLRALKKGPSKRSLEN